MIVETQFRQLERIATSSHKSPIQVRLPPNTTKALQTVAIPVEDQVFLQNVIQFLHAPPSITLIRKSQFLLKVISYPFSQLRRQPSQHGMSIPISVCQVTNFSRFQAKYVQFRVSFEGGLAKVQTLSVDETSSVAVLIGFVDILISYTSFLTKSCATP